MPTRDGRATAHHSKGGALYDDILTNSYCAVFLGCGLSSRYHSDPGECRWPGLDDEGKRGYLPDAVRSHHGYHILGLHDDPV